MRRHFCRREETAMRIKHDFHLHTHLSVCAKREVTAADYVANARRLGLKKLGFSDHFWDSAIEGANKFYQPQDYEHILQLKPELEQLRCDDIQFFFGCETEYDPFHHGVAITEAVAEQLDFLLVPNSHTHMMMPKDCYEPYRKHADFMLQALYEILNSPVSKYITAIAHPFEAVACPYPNGLLIDLITDDEFRRVLDVMAEKGVAFEINVSSMQKKTHDEIEKMSQIRLFRLAKEQGCRFLFGSDSHSAGSHDAYGNASFVADLLALTEDDLAPIARG